MAVELVFPLERGAGGNGGSFNGSNPYDPNWEGEPGGAGTLTAGGAGGVTYPDGGANAGPGGDGGDFNDAAERVQRNSG